MRQLASLFILAEKASELSKYILRRIFIAFPLILAVTTVVFVMLRIALPGDPAKLMAGDRASSELIEQIRHNLGLDRPVFEQYLIFLRNFSQGDLGRSVKFREPVLGVIVKAFPFTAKITFLSVHRRHDHWFGDRHHDGCLSTQLDRQPGAFSRPSSFIRSRHSGSA